jgi:hypothetical protein
MSRLPAELAEPAEWHLPVGLSAAPGWRWAARLCVLGLIALACAWWWSTLEGFRRGQGPHGFWMALSTLGMLAWAWAVARPVWSTLQGGKTGTVLLQWSCAASAHPACRDGIASPWRLADCGVGADVERMLDLQQWLLLKITSQSDPAVRPIWCLVPDRSGPVGDVHRLRVLLSLAARGASRRTSTPIGEGEARRMMASSLPVAGLPASPTARQHMIQAFRRLRGADSGRATSGKSLGQRGFAPSSLFPPTEIEPDRRGR